MGVLLYSVLVLTLICQSHSYNVKSPLDRFKRFEETAWSDPNDCSQIRQPVVMSNSNNFSVDIRMPGVLPKVSDAYFCVAAPVPTSRESYIVDFVPHASMDTAHHMLLYGCRTPYSTKGYWDCGSERGTCMDEAKIMYAWARNAPHTKLPKDVGFRVGGDSKITYFVLQIHYGDINNFRDHHRDCSGLTLSMTSKPQPFIAGMYLMMAVDTVILPGKTVTNADIACTYSSYPMYPFAFRTHTHRLGKVVSGYRVRNGEWTLIGRQSPQLPQAFYPASNAIDVRIGDTLAARCVFTGEGKTTPTHIGGTANDEMCNFYFMYYMENKQATPYMYCMNHGSSSLFRNIPAEANVPIVVSPDHMMTMMHGSSNKDGDADKQPTMKDEEEEAISEGTHLVEMTGWPKAELQLGQVSGLALDSNENLVIFHRGDHVWGIASFDRNAVYQEISLGPIQQSTILVVDPIKGNVLKAFGRNMFFLPHGITTDKDNNYWVTDVALHQVLKLRNDGNPLLTLGEAFVPGSDKNHFCQPTDVAVDPDSGNVYVADGYCNSRILKFSPEGKYLYHWGAGSLDRRKRLPFYIPHSLAFAADKRELLVADRENGRVQCFMADTGEFVKEIKKDEFGGKVFAVSYAPVQGGIIYVVNGQSIYDQSIPVQGFALNYSTKEILDTFAPDTQEFKMPHDIVVAKDGSVFVSDVNLEMVVKFVPSEKMETFMQANLKPSNKQVVHSAAATVPKVPPATEKEQDPVHLPKTLDVNVKEKENENEKKSGQSQGPSPAVITTLLLLLPLVLIIAVGVFIRWKKRRMYGDGHEVKLEPSGSSGGILGKLRGKAAGTLNLGNFFATHKGYTRQGFDRLSTEGSDLEKDDEDATDSENEEYSAPLPPISSS